MSALRGTALVAGREVREATRRKSFWLVLVAMVAASTAGMVLPEVIDGGGPTTYDVAVVGGDEQVAQQLVAAARREDDLRIRTTVADDLDAARARVADEELDLAVGTGPEPAIVVEADGKQELVALVQRVLAEQRLADLLDDAGVDPTAVEEVLGAPAARLEELDQEASGRRAASAIVSIVLYVVLLMLMIQVANGTAIEKANRISEVLLAVVRPGALMFGKVIGIGVLGFATTLAAAVPVLVKIVAGGDLPEGLGGAVLGGIVWLVVGLALYLTLASALGALVERQEEAGNAVGPLNVTLLVAYLVAQTAPESPVASVFAYVPLTSPIVVPVRMAVGATSTVELVVSLGLCVLATLVAARFAAVVYRRAIVRTGRKLKLRDVLVGS